MIIFDPPANYPKFGRCAHLISTVPGEAGARELAEFGARINLKTDWLQKKGTAEEHYDIMRGRIRAAAEAGAVQVTRRAFVQALRAKREGKELKFHVDDRRA